MSTTRINLYRALANRLYRGEQDVITGTATTTTSTTSLKDATRLDYSSADANAYDRRWVYAMAAADASTRGFTRITEGGYAAAGTLALDPALTGLASTDLYVITGHHPDVLHGAINETLRTMYEPSFFPLSLHICASDENDMETAPATTFQANATLAALGDESTIVYNGAQALQVVGSADGGYVHFGSVNVNDGELLYAAIMCSAASGATFRIIDLTNSNATVEDATTDEGKYMDLLFPFTVPTDCEQIHARAISTTSGASTDWDDYQIWYAGQGVYPCPSWLTDSAQLNGPNLGVRAFPRGVGGPSSDNDYRTNERMSVPLNWEVEREDIRADNPLHLWVEGTGGARPYIYALRPLSELSADSNTTTADKDTVVDLAADLVLDPEKGYKRLAAVRAAALARPRPAPAIGTVGVRIR